MKSLLLLWQLVADESAARCCTSATMDIKTVHERSQHEGLSFLTITLPTYGKDFQKSLDLKEVDRRLFTGFRWKGGLPRFLGGFLDRVFDRSSGRLLESPCHDSILAIRQLTLMFSKINLPCSDARTAAAMTSYIQCEQDVRTCDANLGTIDLDAFDRVSRLLFGSAFSYMDRKIHDLESVVPKHGPGATADHLIGNEKYRQREWTQRLDRIFPVSDFLIPNYGFYQSLEEVDVLEPGSERPVRVISVPKTLKTPRIIGIEPTAMQYAQQAILPIVLDGLSRSDSLDAMLGFVDQTPNQRMAYEGSLHGLLATLDLSEASDRVSNQLVRRLFANHPWLNMAVDASRSRKADVPGHGVIRLAKFASMGSALCFPVEAMVFLTMVFVGIEERLNRPLTKKDIKSFSSSVRIYGDDIIVPVEYVHAVISSLESFGARVGQDKSFWNGKFRESCGKEYYDGTDVSIVKVRHKFPATRRDVPEVISIVSLRNQLYYAGYWDATKWLDGEIRKVLKHFPTVSPSSPVLGRHSFLGYESEKLCTQLHRPLVKGYVIKPTLPINMIDGEGALLKYFLKRGKLPIADRNHLERSGRPQAVDIKLRWAPPY